MDCSGTSEWLRDESPLPWGWPGWAVPVLTEPDIMVPGDRAVLMSQVPLARAQPPLSHFRAAWSW